MGTTRCAGLLVETCGDVNGDDCTEFAAPLPCQGGSCSLGVCGPPEDCFDDCTMAGVSQCSGNGVQMCGEFDSDDCLDLGPVMECGEGSTCSSGLCTASCLDECVAGSVVCVGMAGERVCGEWDGDPCLDLGGPISCPMGQYCSTGVTGLMMCQTCTDDCDPTSYTAMCDTGTFTECIVDGDIDPCFEVATVSCDDCLTRPGTDMCWSCCEMCGDFMCTTNESSCTCPIDCGAVCGDGCCNGSESQTTCCMDCTCTPPTTCFGPSGCF